MKKNSKFIGIILLILSVLLILSSLILLKSQENNSFTRNGIYQCTKEVADNDYCKTYYIYQVEVKAKKIIKSDASIEMDFKSKEKYDIFKNDKNIMEGKEANDSELKISYPNSDGTDYLKRFDGTIITQYEEYQENIKKDGYTCRKLDS